MHCVALPARSMPRSPRHPPPPSSLGRLEPKAAAPCSTAPRQRGAHWHHADLEGIIHHTSALDGVALDHTVAVCGSMWQCVAVCSWRSVTALHARRLRLLERRLHASRSNPPVLRVRTRGLQPLHVTRAVNASLAVNAALYCEVNSHRNSLCCSVRRSCL